MLQSNELINWIKLFLKMTNKYLKNCSPSFAISKMWIRILRHYSTPSRMTVFKKKAWEQMRVRLWGKSKGSRMCVEVGVSGGRKGIRWGMGLEIPEEGSRWEKCSLSPSIPHSLLLSLPLSFYTPLPPHTPTHKYTMMKPVALHPAQFFQVKEQSRVFICTLWNEDD